MKVPGGREVIVIREGSGADRRYEIQVKDHPPRNGAAFIPGLTDDEAAALLYSLLDILPDVKLNTKQALQAMRHPRDVLVRYYKAEDGVVREYTRVEFRVSSDDVVIDQVSLAAAKHDATIQAAAKYCAAQGITMKELMAQLEASKKGQE